MRKKILLIGSDINAYYMARCYHELYGVNADALGNEKLQFTQFSNIINITYCPGLKTKKVFVDSLLNYAKDNYKDEKILVVPCHDVYVRLLVENWDLVSDYYVCNCPGYEIVDSFLVKEKFYKMYEKHGLEFPKTYFYNCKNNDKVPKSFRYPIIIKPSNGILYYQHKFEGQAKVYKAQNKKEVEDIIKSIKMSGYDDKLIIQECVMGDDSTLFDAVFYVNKNKKVELATLAQIGLQEHGPTAIGNATVLINGYNEFGGSKELIEKLKKFLEDIGYKGFAEFDLKYDLRDKKFKVLEINPRQARSSYYLCACGYNPVKLLIDDIYENKVRDFKLIDKKYLLSMVPKYVVTHYIDNKKYVKAALKLYKEKKIADPLTYNGDNSIKHKIYLFLRKINYIRKYRKYKW